MTNLSITHTPVRKVNPNGYDLLEDSLAIEEPLEIRIMYGEPGQQITKNLSITMRTPGNDEELATGFLFTEGIIKDISDISAVSSYDNIVTVVVAPTVSLELDKLERHFYTTSSCGVCGKSSIDAVKTVCQIQPSESDIQFSANLIYTLPALLRQQQDVFEHTGGLHASALFDHSGNILLLREDVGRHNALDKLLGATLKANMFPLDNYLLLLSGRASFELIQKAMMAGIKIVAAVGAPSSLAVQLAKESDITLIGFLRDQRFNIYTGDKRIII